MITSEQMDKAFDQTPDGQYDAELVAQFIAALEKSEGFKPYIYSAIRDAKDIVSMLGGTLYQGYLMGRMECIVVREGDHSKLPRVTHTSTPSSAASPTKEN